MNEISLLGGRSVPQPDKTVTRWFGTEMTTVQATAEITHARVDAAAQITAHGLNQLSVLAPMAESLVQQHPALGPMVGAMLNGFAAGTAMVAQRMLR